MKALITALAACAILGSLSRPALAGGESKTNVSVQNVASGADVLAVIVDPPTGAVTNANIFKKGGGKYLFAGQSTKLSVSSGNHSVVAFYITPPFTLGPTATRSVSVKKNKTVKLFISGTAATTPVIAAKS